MEIKSLPHEKIIYVCLNERPAGACCARGGSEAIHAKLKAAVKDRGLSRRVRVSRSGCMDRCGVGPNVLVFPDNIWYSGVTETDVDAILEAVLQGLTP